MRIPLLGWEIRPYKEDPPSFVPKTDDEGSVVVAAGGQYGTYIDLEGQVKNEADLITKYRSMTQHHEVDNAVSNITNETIVQEEGQKMVDIVLDDLEDILDKKVISVLQEEFQGVLELLEWNTHAKDIFRTWYVDGRLAYHDIIDPKQPTAGIIELRYIDSRKIRKIKEIEQETDPEIQKIPGAEMITRTKNEYFVFNPKGFGSNTNPAYNHSSPAQGIKIAKDAITYITSGITNESGTMALSRLHKAIKPLNQLRALEDATIIYRLARAPERRIFYIDTGMLPHYKAEQYVKSIMTKYKNKLVYDATTGEIRDDRKMMTMLEDFWLPRREGGKGTEIDTLPGGNAQGVMDEVEFFKQRLYDALEVPYSRTHPEAMFQGMQAAEISRDEINFGMFIDTLRLRFNLLFLDVLRKQVILKGIMLPEEWDQIEYKIRFTYARNNIFAELKEREVINGRMMTLQLMAPYVGRFYSNKWVQKNVLKQTDEDIEQMEEEIMEEMQNPLYATPLGMPMGEAMGMDGQQGPGMPPGNPMDGLSVQPPLADNQQINNQKKPGK